MALQGRQNVAKIHSPITSTTSLWLSAGICLMLGCQQADSSVVADSPEGAPHQAQQAVSQLEQESSSNPVAVRPVAWNGDLPHASGLPRRPGYPPKVTVDRQAEPLRISFISYGNPQQVVKDTVPIVNFLEQFVGVPIKATVALDYGSSVEAMRGNQTDLAFVDPLAFMMAHEQIGVKPLLLEVYHSGKPTYHSNIWVRKDSGFETLTDLEGKTIAFADQVDMSGHLLPRDIFVRQGLLPSNRLEGEFFEHVYFAGGDEQAVRAVLENFVDAAGVSQYANLLMRLEERDELTSIATSIESPAHLVMARRGLSDETCGRVKQALLALDQNRPADKAILDRLYGIRGYTEAKLSDFAEVAEVAARFGFVKKPELFTDSPQ